MGGLKLSDIEEYGSGSFTARPIPSDEPCTPQPNAVCISGPRIYAEGIVHCHYKEHLDPASNGIQEQESNDDEKEEKDRANPSNNKSSVPPDRSAKRPQPSIKSDPQDEDLSIPAETAVRYKCGNTPRTKSDFFNTVEQQDAHLQGQQNSVIPQFTSAPPLELSPEDKMMEELEDNTMVDSVRGTGSWIHGAETDIRSMKIEEFHDVPVGRRMPGGPTNLFGDKWQSDARQCASGSNQATRGSQTNIPPTSTGWDPNGSGMGSGLPNDGKKGHKRLSAGEGRDDDEGDEDPGSAKKVKVVNALGKGFACPFFKHDSSHFGRCRSYSRKEAYRADGGWASISKLK